MISFGYNHNDEHHDQLRATAREWRAPALWELLPQPVTTAQDVLNIKPPSQPALAGLQTFAHALEVLYWNSGQVAHNVVPELMRRGCESFDRFAANAPGRGGHTLWAMLKAAKNSGIPVVAEEKPLHPRLFHYHLGYPDAVLEFLHAGMGPVLIVLPKLQGTHGEGGVYLGCAISYKGRDVTVFSSGVIDGFIELNIDDLYESLIDDMLPSYGISFKEEPSLSM